MPRQHTGGGRGTVPDPEGDEDLDCKWADAKRRVDDPQRQCVLL